MRKITNDEIKYFESLNIDTKSKYFRSHYKRNLLKNIDEKFVEDIHNYYLKYYNEKVDPVTHIAFANLLNNKDVRLIPQLFYRKKFLNVFNDNAMNDMYRDKGLYDILIDTNQKAYNVIKYTRGQYITKNNKFITEKEAKKILLTDSEEYILKPSDTNNGIGITKLTVKDNQLFIKDKKVKLDDLAQLLGYNYLVQRIIKQHEIMAKLHPNSVNTLRMTTIRWQGEIKNLYSFSRFGHSGDIKDNAGRGGLVVGINNDGTFMDYGVIGSKIVHEHPTTNIKISELNRIPNFHKINEFVRMLHENILLQNFIAWDIAIDKNGEPVFIENNFYGSSWMNQIALNRPMFGELTEDILQFIRDNEPLMSEKNLKSISARRKRTIARLRKKEQKQMNYIKSLKKEIKKLKNNNKKTKLLEREIKKIKNSRSWRYTRLFRKRKK